MSKLELAYAVPTDLLVWFGMVLVSALAFAALLAGLIVEWLMGGFKK